MGCVVRAASRGGVGSCQVAGSGRTEVGELTEVPKAIRVDRQLAHLGMVEEKVKMSYMGPMPSSLGT